MTLTTGSTRNIHAAFDSPAMRAAGSPVLVAVGYLATIAAIAVTFQFLLAEPLPVNVYLLGILLLALCLLPLALWQAGARTGAPMFELLCAAYAIAYAAPVFLHENAIRAFTIYSTLGWGSLEQALQITLTGITAMIAGYYFVPRSPLAGWLPRADLPFESRRLTKVLFVAFGVGGGMQIINRLTNGSLGMKISGALFILFTFILGIGIALLAFRVFRPGMKSPRHLRWLLFGVVGASALLGIGSGMLEDGFIPLLVLLAARWSANRRVPLFLLLLGGVAILVLNTAKSDYRSEVWYAEKLPTIPEQLAVWADKSTVVVNSLSTPTGLNDAIVRTVHRFDLIHIFAHVIDQTPSSLPYYGGDTYSYLIYGWIPRAIWPDKPMASEANITFALDYGLLMDSQRDTTRMGIGFLTEAYANFGAWGVPLAMFIIGCLFGVANTVFNGPQSDGGKAVYVAVMVFFMNGIGSATTMFFFFAAQGFVVLPLFLRYFARSWRAPIAPLPAASLGGGRMAGHDV